MASDARGPVALTDSRTTPLGHPGKREELLKKLAEYDDEGERALSVWPEPSGRTD